MTDRAASITLAGAPLGATRHVCAFFRSEDEEYRVLLPFVRDGIDHGEKAVHIVRPSRREEHLRRLAGAGIDVDASTASGQLDVRLNTETYCRDGEFDQDRMLAAFETIASGHDTGGFPLSRIICDMDWAAEWPSAHTALIEFESRVNDLWNRHDDIVLCVYDLKDVSGSMAIDIMRTHPMVLIGGVLHENPFFIPPREFLRERRVHDA